MISFLFVDGERVWRGGQDQLLTLLHGLILRDHAVHLICYPGTLLEKRAHAIGVRAHPVAIRLQFGLLAMIRMARVLAHCRPDVPAFNTPRLILAGNMASRLVPVKAGIVFRRVYFPLRNSPVTRDQYTWGIDCIVAMSESMDGGPVDDPEAAFQMGLQARKRAEEYFTLQRKILETEQLCYSLLRTAKKVSTGIHA